MEGSGSSAVGNEEHFLCNMLIVLSGFWGGSHKSSISPGISSLGPDEQKGGREYSSSKRDAKEVGDDSRYFHDFV